MSTIMVSAQVYADEILCALSCEELADELIDRLDRKGPHARKDAQRALVKLGFARPTPEDFTDLLDEIEAAAAQNDRMHFAVLMNRLRRGLDPTPPVPVQLAMTAAAEARQ
jgi:hypothetical protein